MTCDHCKDDPPKGHTCPNCGRGESDIIQARACGFAYPPADGTADREQLDRFADFLRMTANRPVGITAETYAYITGEDVAPVPVDADHPATHTLEARTP